MMLQCTLNVMFNYVLFRYSVYVLTLRFCLLASEAVIF